MKLITHYDINIRKNQKIFLVVLVFLIAVNVAINLQYLEFTTRFLYTADDAVHMSIAESFRKYGDFYFQFHFTGPQYSENWPFTSEDLTDRYESPSIYAEKGPIFYILLGTFYQILSTGQEDLNLHGAIFNIILSSIFIIVFFFLIKRNFNFNTAFFSTLTLTLIPFFHYISSRVLLLPLSWLFMISALFFLEKKQSHYILFGIFSGLAHLSHPIGIFLPVSYSIFLLIKKEIKGFLIVFFTWNIVLIPWFLRNYYYYTDIGMGLYIPFSEKITSIIPISFLPHQQQVIIETSYIPTTIWPSESYVPTIRIFTRTVEENIISPEFLFLLLIFIFIFTGFAFFKIEKLKKNLKWMILIISAIILPYYIIFASINILNSNPSILNSIESLVQFFIFVLPPILVALVLTIKIVYKKQLLNVPVPRIFTFILVFGYVNLLGVYYLTVINKWPDLTIHYFFFIIPLFIPLAVFGLHNIINHFTRLRVSKHKNKITIIIMGLVLSPIIFQLVSGIDFNINRERNIFILDEITQTNKYLQQVVPSNATIASNAPGTTWLATGIRTLPLPSADFNQISFEKYLDADDVSYLIFYTNKNTDLPEIYNILYSNLENWLQINYEYTIVSFEKSYAVKVSDVLESDISNPIAYLAKGVKLENLGNADAADVIFTELINYDDDGHDEFSANLQDQICSRFVFFEKYEEAIKKCSRINEVNPKNANAIYNIALSYALTENKEKTMEMAEELYNIYILTGDEKFLKKWSSLVNFLVNYDNYYTLITRSLFEDVKQLQSQNDTFGALFVINSLESIDATSIDALKLKIFILIKLNQKDDVLETYDQLIEKYEIKRLELEARQSIAKMREIQNLEIEVRKSKANFLINQEDYHQANWEYDQILKINKFDLDTWNRKGQYFERYEQWQRALYSYEFALQLEQKNDYLNKKIEELKNIIKNQ